jgi:hypothetical protein
MSNDNITISATENANNLDIVGKYLTHLAKGGTIDPITAATLVFLLADCRVYTAFRDSDSLNDETSNGIRGMIAQCNDEIQRERDLVSAAADEIIADLRKDGINI